MSSYDIEETRTLTFSCGHSQERVASVTVPLDHKESEPAYRKVLAQEWEESASRSCPVCEGTR